MGNIIPFKGGPVAAPAALADMLTISQSDAKAFDDFVRFAERHCCDDVSNKSGAKSRDLRLHLERMRALLDTLIDYSDKEIDLSWTAPDEIRIDEADSLLLFAVTGRSGLHFHKVNIYSLPDDLFFGSLEIAVDANTGETCGLVRIQQWPIDLIGGPRWAQNEADLDATIQAFIDAVPIWTPMHELKDAREATEPE
ncbi:hypothetical protein [Rhizobium sp. RCC_161_2]|uniref:hypothetical protein n=1 Tax=Rhizobium sp. RCC_161_2 TaxID=3239219 RepID=UPI003523E6B1